MTGTTVSGGKRGGEKEGGEGGGAEGGEDGQLLQHHRVRYNQVQGTRLAKIR
jgi:hypothetical protein